MTESDDNKLWDHEVRRDVFAPRDPFETPGLTALIGRQQAVLDKTPIERLIKPKRVLVTGGGGSIGSEICQQVIRHHPTSLFFLDRDEGGLLKTDLLLGHSGLVDAGDAILANIRDLWQHSAPFSTVRTGHCISCCCA